MGIEKLPRISDDGWPEAVVRYVAAEGKKEDDEDRARHGQSLGLAPYNGALGGLMLKAIHVLAKRVQEIHEAAAADAEALNQTVATLADAATQMQGKGMQFMGRWSRNVDYERGDVVAHNGALWVASNATPDAPGVGTAWQRMLKADNRGGFVVGDDHG
jgi:hypothetical protein